VGGGKHSKDRVARGSMKEDLLDIRAGIKAGRYVNEATVSQGVVQRLLNVLGWPVYDTEVVAPEYSLGGRLADYALCHPPREPVILIEVKQVGQSKAGEEEPEDMASQMAQSLKGVPMATRRSWSAAHSLPGPPATKTPRSAPIEVREPGRAARSTSGRPLGCLRVRSSVLRRPEALRGRGDPRRCHGKKES
jgi:hypothetical protein